MRPLYMFDILKDNSRNLKASSRIGAVELEAEHIHVHNKTRRAQGQLSVSCLASFKSVAPASDSAGMNRSRDEKPIVRKGTSG